MNRKSYKILQLKRGADHKLFRSLPEDISTIDIEEYKDVYTGRVEGIDDITILETLFEKFNIDRPVDFKGHSLSVSDVVKLGEKYYFCQSLGWKEVTIREVVISAS